MNNTIEHGCAVYRVGNFISFRKGAYLDVPLLDKLARVAAPTRDLALKIDIARATLLFVLLLLVVFLAVRFVFERKDPPIVAFGAICF